MIHAGIFTQKKAQWERYLFPLKKSLVIHVSDPLQWVYVEPLVRALNRSVVALFRFDVQRADVPNRQGIAALTACETAVDEAGVDCRDVSPADKLAVCLELLQPEGLLLCGCGAAEQEAARLARERGHRMVYNRDVMRQLLEKAGFRHIRFARPGESALPAFRGVEHHGEHIPEWCNALESMTIEATRP